MASIEEGVKEALSQSPPDGYALDDVEVVVYDGSYHETESSPLAFNEAARRAVHHALDKGGRILLEPIMRVRVTVPPEHLSAVVRDLLDRRAQIHSRAEDRLDAEAPLMELRGYGSSLRAMCRGAARVTMEFDRYEVRKPGTSGEDGGAGVREPRAPFPSPPKSRAESIDP
jgi:elongation factor G